jgi:large subunit ribosomal protein L10
MSKYVKDLITDDLRKQLTGVEEFLLVNVVGLDAGKTSALRKELRGKNIRLEVVKNSLARRACEGTPLAPAFEGIEGTLALLWGGEDIVSLAKEAERISKAKEYEGFSAKGGAMGGARLTPEEVARVSTWPSRGEQLSILSGQISGPGSKLVAQLGGVGGALVSQIKQRVDDLGGDNGGGDNAGGAEPAAE